MRQPGLISAFPKKYWEKVLWIKKVCVILPPDYRLESSNN